MRFKYLYFIIAIIIFPVSLIAQIESKGSYIICAIGSDGVIMAADSRTYLYDKTDPMKTPLAYHDSIQKIFIVKNCVLGSTGSNIFNGTYLSTYIEEFNSNYAGHTDVQSIIDDFLLYIKNTHKEIYPEIITNPFYAIGNYFGYAAISMRPSGANRNFFTSGHGFCGTDSNMLLNKKYDAFLTCQQLAKLSELSIYDVAKKEKKEDIIGGPVMILQVHLNNSIEWILNKPSPLRWKTAKDFHRDYSNGKVKIHYIKKDNKKKVDQLFSK